ncbi:hypothetical protein OG899_11325 [Streptomyces thermoviolaceus]|uniref:hypothetical protein n=1 Tax=Streptomyces thermoviolaceus TaxID=1952 RepID=UPI0038699B08|nr:hypothetical protein OG899_11325 [Streptomyces thermoviolaceus]
MVEVGVSELRRSRDRLERQAKAAEGAGGPATSGLLLFYAVECALKAELLRGVLHRNDTSGLPSDLRSHDLRRLAKALKLKAPEAADPLRCRRRRGGGWIECRELHEAWRYGAELRAEDQKAALESLKALLDDARGGERGGRQALHLGGCGCPPGAVRGRRQVARVADGGRCLVGRPGAVRPS